MWTIIGLIAFVLLVGIYFMERSKKHNYNTFKDDEERLYDYKVNRLQEEISQLKEEHKRLSIEMSPKSLKKRKSNLEILERRKDELKSLLKGLKKQ